MYPYNSAVNMWLFCAYQYSFLPLCPRLASSKDIQKNTQQKLSILQVKYSSSTSVLVSVTGTGCNRIGYWHLILQLWRSVLMATALMEDYALDTIFSCLNTGQWWDQQALSAPGDMDSHGE
jgi:hypothetical protein